MRVLVLVHRWLGIACCLLFAMWFASGIVMHFVPYPNPSDAERIAGLAPIDVSGVGRSPAEAIVASAAGDSARIRLMQRSDGPVYVISVGHAIKALHASDLSAAPVSSAELAGAIGKDVATRRGLDASHVAGAELLSRDQWTVAGEFDRHRPLYKVALNDDGGTEFYVSSVTGEIVQQTSRRERLWNYFGSVAHWLYPTVLRSRPTLWTATVWTFSLLAAIAAMAGSVLGLIKLRWHGPRPTSPYQGLRAWHHGLGLASAWFVLTFILSGWLSLDDGLLFATGQPSAVEVAALGGGPSPAGLRDEPRRLDGATREIEWFGFNGNIYRRERLPADAQRLTMVGTQSAGAPRSFLQGDEIAAAVERIAGNCEAPRVVADNDSYPSRSSMAGAPVHRVRCGSLRFDIDGANGVLLEKSDPSWRRYRWLYRALHTFDFPFLVRHRSLRTVVIVAICGWGLLFSITGVVMGWRRLRGIAE